MRISIRPQSWRCGETTPNSRGAARSLDDTRVGVVADTLRPTIRSCEPSQSRHDRQGSIGVRVPPWSIVWPCGLDVAAYLALGQQAEVGKHACPDCGQLLCRWGGYRRWLRGPGTHRLWIRRGRCSDCRRSHALLPDFLVERRLDEVGVIGRALVLGVVTGLGMRIIADQVGLAMTTTRDWRRRFRVRAPALTPAIVALAVHVDPTPVLLEGDAETTAIQALGATWQRARGRFGDRVPRLLRFWNLISGDQALGTNRSPPATWRSGAGWMAPSL